MEHTSSLLLARNFARWTLQTLMTENRGGGTSAGFENLMSDFDMGYRVMGSSVQLVSNLEVCTAEMARVRRKQAGHLAACSTQAVPVKTTTAAQAVTLTKGIPAFADQLAPPQDRYVASTTRIAEASIAETDTHRGRRSDTSAIERGSRLHRLETLAARLNVSLPM